MEIEKNAQKSLFLPFLQLFWREKMNFGNFDEKWKKRPKIIFLAFMQLFWREKMDFENSDEKWKKRQKKLQKSILLNSVMKIVVF